MSKLKDITQNFTVKHFDYLEGTIKKFDETRYNIEIPISKFILDERTVETSLRFDFIKLPNNLESYIGKKITFPVNPIEGYIDGSIYLRDAHNPVDISEIQFIEIEKNKLFVALTMNFVFDFEGIGFENETQVARFILENKTDQLKHDVIMDLKVSNDYEKSENLPYEFKIDVTTANVTELWNAWITYFKEKINPDFAIIRATEDEIITLEKVQNYFKLQTDLKEILSLSNGGEKLFFGLNLLSTTEILQHHLFWEDNLKGQVVGDNVSGNYSVKPEKTIKPEYVNLMRMPFANDGTLNFFNIDNDPDIAGTNGQIINSGRDEYDLVVMSKKLTEFVRKVLLRIASNQTFITSDGNFMLYKNGQGLFYYVKALLQKNEW